VLQEYFTFVRANFAGLWQNSDVGILLWSVVRNQAGRLKDILLPGIGAAREEFAS
jgi:hypothetical protein